MLTHYTRTAEAVANILTRGLAWIPNRRNLAKLLIPQHDFTKREPQQFGMICFTELNPLHAEEHRLDFGPFGIVVSDSWAHEQRAQRVMYVDSQGPVADALVKLFAAGYADVKRRIKYPDDGFWLLAYENKAAASSIVGPGVWPSLLQLWEYLEPAENASQREWRIVNPRPYYGFSEDKCQAIAQVSPPRGWDQHTHVVKISRSDVVAIVCPKDRRAELRVALPREYSDVEVVEVAG